MTDRLATERRLLAALFQYPRETTLTPHHFVAPAHALLFEAMQATEHADIPDAVRTHVYDDHHIVNMDHWLIDNDAYQMFNVVGGFFDYVRRHLQQGDDRDNIDALTEQVRECPRCGR